MKKTKTSPDYSRLAANLLEGSGEDARRKLPAGLYVVATPIGHRGDITLRALMTLAQADVVACEDTRNTGTLLTGYGLKKTLIPYHDHNADAQRPTLLKRIAAGEAVALVSDAGLPLIADPGFKLARACHDEGYAVTVLPGANAALTALAGSGLPTDRFLFAGFLPSKSAARKKALLDVKNIPATLVFYESPQRLTAAMADMVAAFGGERLCAVARELTKLYEETRRGTLAECAAAYAAQEVKGEIVIVVAPPEEETVSVEDVDALLAQALAQHSLRDAVAFVAAQTGINKKAVYAKALALSATPPKKLSKCVK